MKLDLRSRTRYPLVFSAGCLIIAALSFFLNVSERTSVTVTLLSLLGGLTGFLYANHAQEIRLFRELFREFNARYRKLNDRLNAIYERPIGVELKSGDKDVLCDYFNLCAEEFLYANAGCLDAKVWSSWQNGMRHFASDPEILSFWQEELRQDSYYGFTIPK